MSDPQAARAHLPVLSRRALNRTLLARQHLLERVARPPLEVVEHLVGLQAQEPIDPYVALWSRIADFDPVAVSDALAERRAVRIGLMRTTLHLVTTDDATYVSYPGAGHTLDFEPDRSAYLDDMLGWMSARGMRA